MPKDIRPATEKDYANDNQVLQTDTIVFLGSQPELTETDENERENQSSFNEFHPNVKENLCPCERKTLSDILNRSRS